MTDRREDTDLRATSEGGGGPIPEAGFLGRLVDRAGYIFAAGIVAAAAILLFEVFVRYVLGAPTIWAHETTIFLCAIAFIFGGLYCTARNSHVRVVLVYDAVPPGARRMFDVVISLVSCGASVLFAYAAWSIAERGAFAPDGAFRLEGTGSAWNPPTPGLIKLFVFAVMVLLAVQFLILAVNYALGRGSRHP